MLDFRDFAPRKTTPAGWFTVGAWEPFEAVVTEALPNAMFKVRLPNEQKSEVLAYVSGKMRMNFGP